MIINVNNTDIFYEKTGIGDPLILLHGNGEDHHIFDKITDKLKNNYTVYLIDSRNHGQSGKTNEYSYDIMAEDIYQFIKVMELKNIYLLGFSDGAIIGLTLAIKHGEILKKLVLLGVNLKPGDFTEESYKYVKDTYEQTKDPLFKMMLEQPDIDLEDVKNVSIPVLVVAGENDIYKPEMFENLTEALPYGSLKIMKNHGHDSYIVNNDIIYEDLVSFLL